MWVELGAVIARQIFETNSGVKSILRGIIEDFL